ncbi:hypothetical protein [Lentzea sp. E54]|uniref:hypothetical protein n=1 Tax=Lentzea xerophila TaxID=3435883 RepID=UPI003DA4F639
MRRTVCTLLTSCLLALTACTGGGSSTSSTPTAGEADVVAWIDKVCGAVGGTAKIMSDEPPIDMNDPEKLRTGLSEWLGTKITAVEKSIADLKALENGPHARSKELATTAEQGMEQVRTLLADTRSKVDSAADETQVVTAFTEMATKATELENAGAAVRGKFDETGLAGASQKAASCKELQASAPTP